MFDFLFWNTSKRFCFVPIISFDIGTFVLPFWYHFWNTSKRFCFVPIISFDIGTFVLPYWYPGDGDFALGGHSCLSG